MIHLIIILAVFVESSFLKKKGFIWIIGLLQSLPLPFWYNEGIPVHQSAKLLQRRLGECLGRGTAAPATGTATTGSCRMLMDDLMAKLTHFSRSWSGNLWRFFLVKMQVSRLLQRGILWWFPFVWLSEVSPEEVPEPPPEKPRRRSFAEQFGYGAFGQKLYFRWPASVLGGHIYANDDCKDDLDVRLCKIMYISCFSTPFKGWIKTSTTSTDALRARCHPEDSTAATATCTRGTKASLQQRFHWNLSHTWKYWPNSTRLAMWMICGASRKVCVDCLTHSPSFLLFGAKMSNVDTHCWDRIVQLCSTAQVNHKQFYYLATVDHFQTCRFPSCLSFENQLGKGTTNDFGTLLGFYAWLAGSESYTYKSLPKVVISYI